MKSVILAGLAGSTRHYANIFLKHDPDAKVWTLNRGIMNNVVDKCDRFFEMHQFNIFNDDKYDKEYREWLFNHTMNVPVYMVDQHVLVPRSMSYPITAVIFDIFKEVYRMDEKGKRKQSNPYLTSTFSYMLALAIFEQYDRIYLPGFDMKTTTEYAYQKAGAEFLAGIAMGRGIEIVLPDTSVVMKAKLYGYEGAQMVNRQKLEHWERVYTMQFQKNISEVNRLVGLHTQTITELAHDDTEEAVEKIEASAEEINEKVFEAQRSSGALDAIKKLIEECDLQEPVEELPQRMARLQVA